MYKTKKSPPKDVLSVIPEGDEIIWHGRPDVRRFSLSALGLKYILLYLLVVTVFNLQKSFGTITPFTFLQIMFPYIVSCCLALVLLVLVGLSQIYPTLYVVTSKRVIIKSGFALIFMLNVPFDKIENIDKKVFNDGCGDISFKLISSKRVPFFAGWPSVRPWYFNNPEPTFRCIPNVNLVALELANAAQARVSDLNQKKRKSSDPEENQEIPA